MTHRNHLLLPCAPWWLKDRWVRHLHKVEKPPARDFHDKALSVFGWSDLFIFKSHMQSCSSETKCKAMTRNYYTNTTAQTKVFHIRGYNGSQKWCMDCIQTGLLTWYQHKVVHNTFGDMVRLYTPLWWILKAIPVFFRLDICNFD